VIVFIGKTHLQGDNLKGKPCVTIRWTKETSVEAYTCDGGLEDAAFRSTGERKHESGATHNSTPRVYHRSIRKGNLAGDM
jgi:hypothetical protein